MQSRRLTRFLPLGLGLIGVALLWVYLAPTGMGGSTTYVVTDGVSMKPRFHAGDLVLVRRQSSYHVGEIVAYNSKVFHTIVLHRIIALDGDRYVFKGDNNNFVDFEHPAKGQLIGALWLHIPGAGARLESLRSPALVGLLVMGGMLLFLGAAFTRRRRRRGRERRAGETGARSSIAVAARLHLQRTARSLAGSSEGMPRPVGGVLIVGAIVLLPFLALALLAFTRSSTASVPSKTPYTQSANFAYSATATPGPAYTGNRVVTGEPMFTHVLSDVNFRVVYAFRTAAPHSIAGTASLDAMLRSTSGWRKTLVLSPPTAFRGDRAVISTNMDLQALSRLLSSVEKITDVNGSFTLTLVPHVSAGGKVAGTVVHATYSPELRFSISPVELQPVSSAGSAVVDGLASEPPFTQSVSAVVAGNTSRPQYLNFKFARLSVASARAISLLAIVMILAATLAALAWLRPRRREETDAIQARYRRMIVPVERVWQLPGVSVIEVADMDALARIAEHYDRSILHELTDQGDAFWVTDESGQFRYSVEAPLAARESYSAEHPLDLLVSERYADEPVSVGVAASTPGDAVTAEHPAAYAPAGEPADMFAAHEPTAAQGAPAAAQARAEIAAVQVAAEEAAAQQAAARQAAAREAAISDAAATDAAMRKTNAWNAAWEAGAGDRRAGKPFVPHRGV